MSAVPTNLYEVLGLRPNATKDEIRRQYKKLALQYHPDKNTDGTASQKQRAEVMFKAVARAYEVLHDEARRRQYDLYGQEGEQQQQQQQQQASRSHSWGSPHPSAGGGHRSGGQHQQQPFGGGSGFPDPFMSGLFGGHHRGGAGFPSFHAAGRHPFDAFSFTDPFELFERMLGREFAGFPFDPFHHHHLHQQSEGQGSQHRRHPADEQASSTMRRQQRQHPSMMMGGGMFGMMTPFHDVFGGGGDPFGGFGGFMSGPGATSSASFMSSSSTSRNGSGGFVESVSTVTEIRNGQRVTKTVRRTQDPNGIVREHVDEEVADLRSNGSSGYAQQHHQHLPLRGNTRAIHHF